MVRVLVWYHGTHTSSVEESPFRFESPLKKKRERLLTFDFGIWTIFFVVKIILALFFVTLEKRGGGTKNR